MNPWFRSLQWLDFWETGPSPAGVMQVSPRPPAVVRGEALSRPQNPDIELRRSGVVTRLLNDPRICARVPFRAAGHEGSRSATGERSRSPRLSTHGLCLDVSEELADDVGGKQEVGTERRVVSSRDDADLMDAVRIPLYALDFGLFTIAVQQYQHRDTNLG